MGEARYRKMSPRFNGDSLENSDGSGTKDNDVRRKIYMLERRNFSWTRNPGVYVDKDARFG